MFNEDITERDRELRETRVSLIGARSQAEQAAQLAQDAFTRLRDAVEAVPEGFVLFDAEDRHVLWNARYAETIRTINATFIKECPSKTLFDRYWQLAAIRKKAKRKPISATGLPNIKQAKLASCSN